MPSRERIQAIIDRVKLERGAAPDPWLDDSEDWPREELPAVTSTMPVREPPASAPDAPLGWLANNGGRKD